MTTISIGDAVRITRGEHEGRIGRVVDRQAEFDRVIRPDCPLAAEHRAGLVTPAGHVAVRLYPQVIALVPADSVALVAPTEASDDSSRDAEILAGPPNVVGSRYDPDTRTWEWFVEWVRGGHALRRIEGTARDYADVINQQRATVGVGAIDN